MPAFQDLTGHTFGFLTVLFRTGFHRSMWKCRCVCGKEMDTRAHSLKKGLVKSCGCKTSEFHSQHARKHGMSNTRQYTIYQLMMQRCYSKTTRGYAGYGGRGIEVCERWREGFENFWEDMGPTYEKSLLLERVLNDGPYSQKNCKWATRTEQQNNRRTSNFIEAFGQKMTAPQWSRHTGVPVESIRGRLRLGWSNEDAVSLSRKTKGWQTKLGA